MFEYHESTISKFMKIGNIIISLNGIKSIDKIGGINPHIMICYFGESEPTCIHTDNLDEIFSEIFKAL